MIFQQGGSGSFGLIEPPYLPLTNPSCGIMAITFKASPHSQLLEFSR
jgi:hypothetical protein